MPAKRNFNVNKRYWILRRFPQWAAVVLLAWSVSQAIADVKQAESPTSDATGTRRVDFTPQLDGLKLPATVTLGQCSAVDFDSRGRLYVFHRGKRPILCFDRDGTFLRSWGDDIIGKAHGLRVDRADNVWVTDIGHHTVFKFSPTGKLLLSLGQVDRPGLGTNQFNKPTDVAFGPKGEIFVSDGYGNSRVMKFSANGKFLASWGKPGKGRGEFNLPHAILVDSTGRVLVGDRENDRVQVFDTDGKLLAIWDGFAPFGMEFDRSGNLFVADGRANAVLRIGSAGRVVGKWGRKGKKPGEFHLPHMLAADAKGNLYIAEVGNRRVQKLIRNPMQATRRGLTIVTLGDSITKGVRKGVRPRQTFAALVQAQLKTSGRSARVVNVGIGGERTDQALKRLDRVIALQPDIVTVMYGTNDSYVDRGKSASRLTLKQFRENLNRIVAELLRRGIRPVLMTEPRWAADARPNGLGENPNVRLEPYMAACREIAKQWRVPLVDHFAAWTAAGKKGVKLRDWTTDGCHPNPVGHRQLAAAMLPALRSAIGPALKARKKLLAGGKLRVVCFGDSVTGVYYHTGSRRAYTDMLGIGLRRVAPNAKVEMVNAGVSGHTTANALARIDRDVLRRKPDLVTVMFGLNDMTRVPLEAYRANLKQIVKKCRAVGAEVILATPNNVIDTTGRPTKKLIAYCDVVREVAGELDVPLCDVYRELAAVRARDTAGWRLLMSDAIHPNMDGHKRIATALAQTITGMRLTLDDVPPPQPALARTLRLLRDKKPVRVLAMPPFDKLITPGIRNVFPGANVNVESWTVAGMSLAAIERDAKSRVRKAKPDLVLIAVPRSARAESRDAFAKSYTWIMNWSVNFGPPSWDCVVVHPAVTEPPAKPRARDAFIRRLVGAQDLPLIDRSAGRDDKSSKILDDWLRRQAGLRSR